jgi:hypothetical protein
MTCSLVAGILIGAGFAVWGAHLFAGSTPITGDYFWHDGTLYNYHGVGDIPIANTSTVPPYPYPSTPFENANFSLVLVVLNNTGGTVLSGWAEGGWGPLNWFNISDRETRPVWVSPDGSLDVVWQGGQLAYLLVRAGV